VIGWGWFYLSTILDDYSRYVIGWKLRSNMQAEDVTDTPDIALAASGCNSAKVLHKPRLLTDNGKEFTGRLFGLRKRSPTGQHEFDRLCADLGIEHRLAPPQHPQTNGIPLGDCLQSPAGQRVERFNGRIEDVLQSHHFRSGEELETTLHRYVLLYNQQLPQSALGSKTPLQVVKDCHKLNRNHSGSSHITFRDVTRIECPWFVGFSLVSPMASSFFGGYRRTDGS
jgi:hypothetical protein